MAVVEVRKSDMLASEVCEDRMRHSFSGIAVGFRSSASLCAKVQPSSSHMPLSMRVGQSFVKRRSGNGFFSSSACAKLHIPRFLHLPLRKKVQSFVLWNLFLLTGAAAGTSGGTSTSALLLSPSCAVASAQLISAVPETEPAEEPADAVWPLLETSSDAVDCWLRLCDAASASSELPQDVIEASISLLSFKAPSCSNARPLSVQVWEGGTCTGPGTTIPGSKGSGTAKPVLTAAVLADMVERRRRSPPSRGKFLSCSLLWAKVHRSSSQLPVSISTGQSFVRNKSGTGFTSAELCAKLHALPLKQLPVT
mmetsp:Transcript_43166/g.92071  ORF Transcript_43166/g.92071 Transcript_43166/m.92071 type:complete len:309 (-) Transcript_43166:220-1146(-)